MDDTVYEEKLRGHTIKIIHDPDIESPRDWDNLGTMACWHRRYTLGDEQPSESWPLYLARLVNDLYQDDYKAHRLYREAGESWDDLYGMSESWIEHRWLDDSGQLLDAISMKAVILPLYLYDHSGITMNTTGFHCPWDSGQVGVVHADLESTRKEYGRKRVTRALRERVAEQLRREVAVYDDYLTGNCYGYVVEKDSEEVDSCWGFLGDYDDYCLLEARAAVPTERTHVAS